MKRCVSGNLCIMFSWFSCFSMEAVDEDTTPISLQREAVGGSGRPAGVITFPQGLPSLGCSPVMTECGRVLPDPFSPTRDSSSGQPLLEAVLAETFSEPLLMLLLSLFPFMGAQGLWWSEALSTCSEPSPLSLSQGFPPVSA